MKQAFGSKKTASILGVGIVLFGVFLVVTPGHAGFGDDIVRGMAWILGTIVGYLGQLLLLVISLLIRIAQYNGFVDSVPVATGWVIVRDVTNMFFILVLLLIAFGTMFGSDTYSYRNKTLSRFLIIAIVVNFSRTIAGLLIDFAQVVMLTFVNGFAAAAGGNFVEALGIGQLMQVNPKASDSGATSVVVSFFAALTFVAMSLLLMISMVAVLLVRIVYLWIMVILSPLAFFMKAVPSGAAQSYYAEWWKMFTQQVIVGPVLAFFLWLSLVSVAAGDSLLGDIGGGAAESVGSEGGEALSTLLNVDSLQQFAISFALLAGGMMMAQRLSPQGAQLAGKAKGLAKSATKRVARMTGVPAALDQRKADREAKYKARGGRLRGGYNRLTGGLSEAAARTLRSPAALNRMNQRKMANIDKQLAKTPLGEERNKLLEQKQDLKAKMSEAPGLAGKTFGRVGNLFAGKAARDQSIARRAGLGALESETKDAKTKSNPDLISSINDQSLSSRERIAASLTAAQKGLLNDPDLARAARANMKDGDEGMRNMFESDMSAKNPLGAENSAQLLDASKLKMQELTAETAGENAVAIVSSKAAHKYIADADINQTAAMHKTLAGLPEADKTTATRKAELATQSEGGLKTAFGVSAEGSFSRPDLKDALAGVIRSPGGGGALVKVEKGELQTKDKKLTEAGRTVAGALAKNPGAANSLVKEVDRLPSDKSNAAMSEVLSSAITASREEQKKPEGARDEDLANLEAKLRQNRSVRDKLPPSEGGGAERGAPTGGTGDGSAKGDQPTIVQASSTGGGARTVEVNVDADITAELGTTLEDATNEQLMAKINELNSVAGRGGKAAERAAKLAERMEQQIRSNEKKNRPKPTSRQT